MTMYFRSHALLVGIAIAQLGGCASTSRRTDWELAHEPYPEAQAQLRAVLTEMVHDAETGDLERLRAAHLASAMFTKFGARSFERRNVEECNASEADFFTSRQNLGFEMKEVKINVFGHVAVITCYNHASYDLDGDRQEGIARNTLVFLKTAEGWKFVHEHVTPKTCFAQAQRRPDEEE
jgi:ketosteroid isomerase-like protein